jgi:hypothetical protein
MMIGSLSSIEDRFTPMVLSTAAPSVDWRAWMLLGLLRLDTCITVVEVVVEAVALVVVGRRSLDDAIVVDKGIALSMSFSVPTIAPITGRSLLSSSCFDCSNDDDDEEEERLPSFLRPRDFFAADPPLPIPMTTASPPTEDI